MKKLIPLCMVSLTLAFSAGAQSVRHIAPASIKPMPDVNFGDMISIWELMDSIGYDSLSEYQQGLINLMEDDVVLGHFYSASCSWYCGGMIDTVVASSCKKPDGGQSYIGMNTHDWNIQSAWLTGKAKRGVGTSLTYTFPAQCPRITNVLILNGCVRTSNDWQNYARVKKMKVYYDGKPYAILELKDTNGLQQFDVGVLGFRHVERDNPWTLRFEILEVYPGKKYPNAAITELYFDGIDVH